MALEVKVPDIGDFKNVEIIEILVHEGDEIKKNDPLITLESDKSSVEIPSPYDGKISNIKVKVGDKVSQGSLIAIISNGTSEKITSPVNKKDIIPPETEKIIKQAEQNLEINTSNLKNGTSQIASYDNTKSFRKYLNDNGSKNFHDDVDPDETNEWIESLNDVVERDGPRRAHYLIGKLINQAYISGSNIPYNQKTPYINTIPPEMQAKHPGNQNIENKIRSLIRWNAACMVVKANKKSSELGGHIATFASAATLYDVGFNHFWRAQNDKFLGDLIYFQGHCAPGIYSRSFLEGRFTAKQLENFRQEVEGNGLSSYPHPWLMPNYWQFPTVSMGLGPIMAIYQARFMKYLQNRGLIEDQNRKVWAFLGDGEMDEPESTGAISLASREKLDNLIFVINCNLQRLDGPVRGNGKIIQELEGVFRGAGWNVIKVIWGSYWDPLITKDKTGLLLKRMEEAVDGEYQAFKAKGGAYVRSHFFGKYPELLELVSDMTDDDIWKLNRGGHDPHKVYAAYHAA
ncbi:MAG: biotin/lipoyl-binding protein, partial [Pelagibacterales bacterium]|nr:biotin/lipoyl-binding protein [Pelagibacterales bacterium]